MFHMISIHVLRAEDDGIIETANIKPTTFQSTSSVRRTTPADGPKAVSATISIHVLRAEDDDFANIERKIDNVFQSTSSVRRTTPEFKFVPDDILYFNPRPPCGGRRR